MGEKLLFHAASAPEAGIITGILEHAGIPFFEKTPGAGTVYMASMNMGVKIYVGEDRYEEALALIDGCLSENENFSEESDDQTDGEG